MRVFVSYSRRDAAAVRPIVAALEADGHDVWIDTDDIEGSDRWRAEVAEAIRRADVVVLMVSPASMSSSSVEREMAVAAEDLRRIVPVLIEPSPLSAGLRYDLAGVQHVSFVDRPFEEGMTDLRQAIAPQPASSAEAEATMPSSLPPPASASGKPIATTAELDEGLAPSGTEDTEPARTRRRPMIVVAVIAAIAIVAAVVLLTTVGRDDDDTAESDDGESTGAPATAETAGEDAPASSPAPLDTDGSVDGASPGDEPAGEAPLTEASFESSVWFAGFDIAVTEASYDEISGNLFVEASFTNTQPGTSDVLALFQEDAALVVDGTRHHISCAGCARLPPGSATQVKLESSVRSEVDLADASIEFGSPEQHQAIVPLDGGPTTGGDAPTTQPLTGSLVEEGVVTFTLERLDIVPGECSGHPTDLRYVAGPSDRVSFVIFGTALSSHRYPINFGDAKLTLPDGTTMASNSLNGSMYALTDGVPESDIPACFSVPLPLAGEYGFTATSTGSSTIPEPIVIAF